MVLPDKFSDSVCWYKSALVLVSLLCLLLQPSQLLAVTCDKCGLFYDENDYTSCPWQNCYLAEEYRVSLPVTCGECGLAYDREDFASCPAPSCSQDDEDELSQHGSSPSQASPTANHDSNSNAESDESSINLEFAINVFSHAAPRIPENFVFSPDSLFQTLALILLNSGTEGVTEQLSQISSEEDYSQPPGATASNATIFGQDISRIANGLLTASQIEPLGIYKERLKQINDNIRSNAKPTNARPIKNLAHMLNGLFCQLTTTFVESYCNSDDWPSYLRLDLIASFYFIGLWEKSFNTQNAILFTLPIQQAAALDEIMKGTINPSQHAHYNDWEAVTFPYEADEEIVLILPPAGVEPSEISSEIITALFSSLDSEESFSPSSTMTDELPFSNIDTSTDFSETLSRPASGLAAVFMSELSSEVMLPIPAPMNLFSKQETPRAALTKAGSKRTHKGDIIKPIPLNRPLIYVLRNQITNRIFFIGQILHPWGSVDR
ncbi:serpin family protein [Endozoicomonas sp. 4G]|uniref:serpin family protein n=1 Tax=Endozoicomonas sp. 4G TaxID=2872754 RepID=UPI0020786A4B|nr:serpin family protein [Endozoicomonas sp. 4G]